MRACDAGSPCRDDYICVQPMLPAAQTPDDTALVFSTASGNRVTVAKDFYAGGSNGAFLKEVHADTCSLFQVVLGPGSDGMHENHFHMDLGRWKACR